MQNFRGTSINKNRDGWVEINLSNLEHNVLKIKEYLKNNCKGSIPDLFAVIKADGYGHGSLMCAPTLIACGVKEFGVASIDEGIELRENKITNPILVLGASPIWAFENAIQNDIAISVFNDEHLDVARQLYKRLNKQLKRFQSVVEPYKDQFKKIGAKIHCLNSPGTFSYPEYCYDMIRMGIIMWGLTPYSNYNEYVSDMLPVMGLKARITNIHTLKKGEGISYGHTFIAPKDMLVATIPIGYADGIARNLSGKITASLNGKTINQIGRITMDQIMFDVSDVDCSVGDVMVLLGEENKADSIDSWAEKLNTINYELTCRLKMRLPRIYVR